MELGSKVTSEDDVRDRDNERASLVTRVQVRFGRMHVVKFGDGGIERCEYFDVSQRTRIQRLEVLGEGEKSAHAAGAIAYGSGNFVSQKRKE